MKNIRIYIAADSATHRWPKNNKTNLVNQLGGLLDPGGLVVIENTARTAEGEGISVSLLHSTCSIRGTSTVFYQAEGGCLPFELDLALEVLEEDEVLQEDVPSEVAVAELQVHQLGGERIHSQNHSWTWVQN